MSGSGSMTKPDNTDNTGQRGLVRAADARTDRTPPYRGMSACPVRGASDHIAEAFKTRVTPKNRVG